MVSAALVGRRGGRTHGEGCDGGRGHEGQGCCDDDGTTGSAVHGTLQGDVGAHP